MVYRTPYPWYIEPPTHGILTPLPMVYQTSYPWYSDPPTHGTFVYRTPYLGILTPYPRNIKPPIHGILTPLPMVYRTPYPWYFDPPTHGITNPLLRYYEPLSFGRNEGGQFTMRGFKIQ